MKRFLFIILLFLLVFLSPEKIWAMELFGPHLSTYSDPAFLSNLRKIYNQYGSDDWVPVNILVEPSISGKRLNDLLTSARQNKFWPVLRLFNSGKKIGTGEIDQFIPALEKANDNTSGFPEGIYIEFGNEVNYGSVEWSDSVNPSEYSIALEEFISKIKANASNFKVANAAMNTTLTVLEGKDGENANYDAIRFWEAGPKKSIGQLDALAFNAYELGVQEERYTINSWNWEWQQLGKPDKPIILTEFGYSPTADIDQRMQFVEKEYASYVTGQKVFPKEVKILAITPLLQISPGNDVKIPIFQSLNNKITWYDGQKISMGIFDKPTPTGSLGTKTNPTQPDQSQGGVYSWLIGLFRQNPTGNTNELVKKYVESLIPRMKIVPAQTTTATNITPVPATGAKSADKKESEEIQSTVTYYTLGTGIKIPKEESKPSVTNNLIAFFGSIGLDNLIDLGNNKAGQLAASYLPPYVSSVQSKGAAQPQAQPGKDTRMADSFNYIQCSFFPYPISKILKCNLNTK